ncbi:MAG: type II toxin-antitoxin system HicA family toxin [Candidatus Peregrinibacteria bacterium]|nr:type II toxin-antitoxin system HicA family toxin [Candidatus Peregrinibacteria bacterium]
MTKEEKLILKFKTSPQSISLVDLLKLMKWLGIEIIEGKGSHVVCKIENKTLIVIPVHNNNCKPFYKKKSLKILVSNNLLS